ncbi:MAG: DNA polymerase I [Alphaproteobacteria bacterium]|nr:DNA polymerase I [Alphaproteobacteria bacterium]
MTDTKTPTGETAATSQPRDEICTVPDGDPAPVEKGSHVYLVDGSGYIFRAFHALPPLTRPSDGLPVGAVHGFCQMLWKLLADSKASEAPTHMAVIFDYSAKTFRNDIYEHYKAQRPPPPEELVPQFPLIREAVKAFNVACIEQDGYEADDLIATYAKRVVEAGGDVTIVSSDKDLMQLVGPGVVMFDGMKNKKIGPAEVVEKFGVPPDKVVDVQSLAGDPVDNIPGVPGIGVKTAAQLIGEYGDLDQLLARAGEIKQPKRREKLIEFADQARLSRQLVTLATDAPLNVAAHRLAVQPAASDQLLAFLRAMEFNTLTRRIAEAMGAEPPPALPQSVGSSIAAMGSRGGEAIAKAIGRSASVGDAGTPRAAVLHGQRIATSVGFDRAAYPTITTREDLESWVTEAWNAGHVAFDTETGDLDASRAELVGFSLATAPGRACYVPLQHKLDDGGLDFGDGGGLDQMPLKDALGIIKPLLEDASILKIGQNLKYDVVVMARYGIEIAGLDDTMLISYALDGGRGSHGMDDLAERHLQHTSISFKQVIAHAPGKKAADRSFAQVPIDKATEYAAEDADITLRLWHVLKPRLVAEGMTTVYETLERPLVRVIADMEREGVKVDRAILSRLSGTFQQRIGALDAAVCELVGEKFNLGSPRQLGELLFEKLKLPGGKKTKTGQWETRAGLLDDLAGNEELPDDARKLVQTMLEWRQLSKLKSTYTDALPTFIDAGGRIHTSYSMASTTTGRLASSEPNLQNIPVRTKEGREIRTAFIAEKGNQLISADYSQIELRVLAHIADIPQLKKAFDEGLDIHAMTASEMFGVPIEGMPGEVRRRAKAINFGIIYGISAFGLANQLSIPRQEAGEYIKTYFQRFPGIRTYMERTKEFAREYGYVETVFGRKVHYPEINTKNPSMRGFLERAAINAPIQGSAADIIRRAMVRMPHALAAAGLKSARMLLQVHDELIFEASKAEAGDVIAVAREVMEGSCLPAVQLSVPIHVDAKAADNWDEAH